MKYEALRNCRSLTRSSSFAIALSPRLVLGKSVTSPFGFVPSLAGNRVASLWLKGLSEMPCASKFASASGMLLAGSPPRDTVAGVEKIWVNSDEAAHAFVSNKKEELVGNEMSASSGAE